MRMGLHLIVSASLLLTTTNAVAADSLARIGILLPGSTENHGGYIEALRAGLRDTGYAEGRDIVIEDRWGRGNRKRLFAEAAALAQRKPAVIVVIGVGAARAARKATKTIPIVVALGTDLVGSGLVESLARPGGNVTGLTSLALELGEKRIELLRTTLPRLSRLAMLFEPTSSARAAVARANSVGERIGLTIDPVPVRRPEDFEDAFERMTRMRTDAVILIVSRMMAVHRKRLIDLARKSEIPAMCWRPEMARAGCLMSYGADRIDMVRRAARYVVQILEGAAPATLPVERPLKFELVVNLAVAKALGISIPPSILLRATEVIE